MKQFICILGLFLLFSCNNQEEKARQELQKAQNMYNIQEYFGARQTLDSLKIKYPKEFPVLKEGQLLIKKIELAEQTRNLRYCDSLLIDRNIEFESLKKDFIFEKDTVYEEIGKYIHKSQKIELNVQKSYIRSGVFETGDMFISSVYYGAKPIKHTALKINAKSGEYAQTEAIPHDGGNNYSFIDGGMTTETVTYSKGKDNGVILFIYNKIKEPVTATYIGERNISITMSNSDKTAITAAYNLSVTLSDIERLKKESKIAQAKIDYLETLIK